MTICMDIRSIELLCTFAVNDLLLPKHTKMFRSKCSLLNLIRLYSIAKWLSSGFGPRVVEAFPVITNACHKSRCFCACDLTISEILHDTRIKFLRV